MSRVTCAVFLALSACVQTPAAEAPRSYGLEPTAYPLAPCLPTGVPAAQAVSGIPNSVGSGPLVSTASPDVSPRPAVDAEAELSRDATRLRREVLSWDVGMGAAIVFDVPNEPAVEFIFTSARAAERSNGHHVWRLRALANGKTFRALYVRLSSLHAGLAECVLGEKYTDEEISPTDPYSIWTSDAGGSCRFELSAVGTSFEGPTSGVFVERHTGKHFRFHGWVIINR